MKKLYTLIIVIMILCFNGCGKSDNGLIKQLFGIDVSDYQLINSDNTLSNLKYGGALAIKLNVKKDQMDKFISEIKEVQFNLVGDKTNYDNPVKNTTGMEINDNMIIYERLGSVKRTILLAAKPKTVMSMVIYSECIDGVYEVTMDYSEQELEQKKGIVR